VLHHFLQKLQEDNLASTSVVILVPSWRTWESCDMLRLLMSCTLAAMTVVGFGEHPMNLPTPHYERKPNDPAWLAYSTQFHGHLGPWATAGLRVGMAGRRAVAADGYFDIDVTVSGPFAKPPKSCFLDGLQVATGATWGKRNIRWNTQEKIVVQIKNTRSGELVEIRPTAKLMELVTSFKPDSSAKSRDDRALGAIARKIAGLPESQVLELRRFPGGR